MKQATKPELCVARLLLSVTSLLLICVNWPFKPAGLWKQMFQMWVLYSCQMFECCNLSFE